MKNIQIIMLVLIVIAITALISFMGSLSSYDTVETAKSKQGAFVHLVARLDHTQPIEYDALKNPNFLSFTAVDSLGGAIKVVYYNAKPDNLEMSDRLVLKGTMKQEYFECKEILMKCPSKYKEDGKEAAKHFPLIRN